MKALPGTLRWATLGVALVAVHAPGLARAELDHQLSALVAGDIWLAPEAGGHGAVLLDYQLSGLPAASRFSATLNTDTLTLAIDDLHLGDTVWRAGGAVRGEIGFAGLLPDYYRAGLLVPEAGFSASYLEASGYLRAAPGGGHFLDLRTAVRRWFFARNDGTAAELVLPAEAWVFEPRLHYTYWGFDGDPSLSESHRTSPRVRGIGGGLEFGLDLRSEARRWGLPDDPRNQPDTPIWLLRQWWRGGIQLHPRLRLQAAEWAGAGLGDDDLTRQRIGGLNPYVVPVAGVPWAAFLASRYLAGQVSAHVRVYEEIELGPFVEAVVLQDPDRSGSREAGGVAGVGGFVDLRWDSWQADLRLGWAPPLGWQAQTPNFSVFFAVGKQFF